jgi:hypothetical protein
LVKTTNKDLMYISLDVVNVWHHVILCALYMGHSVGRYSWMVLV